MSFDFVNNEKKVEEIEKEKDNDAKNIIEYEENKNLNIELLTPTEDEIKENDSYSCTECQSNIEITSIDDINNIISFKCPSHGSKTMTIKDYLKNMKQNTYFYSICSNCKKQQNTTYSNKIFNFCTNCQLVICDKCILNHNNSHLIIKNNKISTTCSLHPKNNNTIFCVDCNCHLCKECIKHRKHLRHKKQIIEEIQPSNEEINYLLKIINEYENKRNSSEIEKQNKLIDIENKYNKDKENEEKEYNKILLNTNKEMEYELTENENNKEINEIKQKYEKELIDKKNILDKNKKCINDKYIVINKNNKDNYDKKLNIIESKYKFEINKLENSFIQKINHLNELLNLNNIIYNTYNKNKENYYYNINIINILINYYERGNEIIKDIKDNEDFIETINQKDYEMNKIKNNKLKNEKYNIGNEKKELFYYENKEKEEEKYYDEKKDDKIDDIKEDVKNYEEEKNYYENDLSKKNKKIENKENYKINDQIIENILKEEIEKDNIKEEKELIDEGLNFNNIIQNENYDKNDIKEKINIEPIIEEKKNYYINDIKEKINIEPKIEEKKN